MTQSKYDSFFWALEHVSHDTIQEVLQEYLRKGIKHMYVRGEHVDRIEVPELW